MAHSEPQPEGIDMPAPIVDGERRTDPAKPKFNLSPEFEFLEVLEAVK